MDFARRRLWAKYVAGAFVFLVVVDLLVQHLYPARRSSIRYSATVRPVAYEDIRVRPGQHILPCVDAGGELVNGSLPLEAVLTGTLPQPWTGSYAELGLRQTWTTFEQRYAPYGGGGGGGAARDQSRWANANWARLQDECRARNAHHLPTSTANADGSSAFATRMRLPEPGEILAAESEPRPKVTTGRTAIVLRTYDKYDYTPEDLWYVRALITETSLVYGGTYDVYLLVDYKGGADIWETTEIYDEALKRSVPEEFRGMAVLFDTKLREAWYERVREYRPVLQIQQGLQLFAHFFDTYDHFWQFEMDVRFTGHAGHMLEGLSHFATSEPRKQSNQRTTYYFTPEIYGDYATFLKAVNTSLDGNDAYYGGIRIPEIRHPRGLALAPPPVSNPQDDDFAWGVGEEADLVLLGPTMNATLDHNWIFRPFVFNFTQGVETPRMSSAPGMSRYSWNLLSAAHDGQRIQGLALPGEATMPSFALWHGFKTSHPPFVMYSRMDAELGTAFIDLWANNGPPKAEHDGMARPESHYGHQFFTDPALKEGPYTYVGPTWRFASDYPQNLWNAWKEGSTRNHFIRDGHVPTVKVLDGRVWVPSVVLHPVKTNEKRPEDLGWMFEPGGIPTGEKKKDQDEGGEVVHEGIAA